MIQQYSNSNKKLLILFLFGIMTTMYSPAQIDFNRQWDEVYGDTIIELSIPYFGSSWLITEAIYKAIDPRLIANKYGILREDSHNGFKGKKGFSIFIYDGVSPGGNVASPIFGGHKKWNYYINDINLFSDGRALITTIMPQAIEGVDFMLPSQNFDVPKGFPGYGSFNKGIVRFFIRDISKITINDNATVYLVNDSLVITRKIFEAVNPAFIRSLRRITNPEELADCGYKDKTEIVKIDLFGINDLIEEVIVSSNECPECYVTLLDNIPIDWKTYQILYNALDYFHIKEIREITEDDKKNFAPYRKLFTKKKSPGMSMKNITIIHHFYSTKIKYIFHISKPWRNGLNLFLRILLKHLYC
jgi:hypothetical protein